MRHSRRPTTARQQRPQSRSTYPGTLIRVSSNAYLTQVARPKPATHAAPSPTASKTRAAGRRLGCVVISHTSSTIGPLQLLSRSCAHSCYGLIWRIRVTMDSAVTTCSYSGVRRAIYTPIRPTRSGGWARPSRAWFLDRRRRHRTRCDGGLAATRRLQTDDAYIYWPADATNWGRSCKALWSESCYHRYAKSKMTMW